jgi:hypothetical protein
MLFAGATCADKREDHVSKNFERWKELATLCLGEQDPTKLMELAKEMNLALTQRTPALDSSMAIAMQQAKPVGG